MNVKGHKRSYTCISFNISKNPSLIFTKVSGKTYFDQTDNLEPSPWSCIDIKSHKIAFPSISPKILHLSSQSFQARPTLTQLTILNPPHGHAWTQKVIKGKKNHTIFFAFLAISDHFESYETQHFWVIFSVINDHPHPA